MSFNFYSPKIAKREYPCPSLIAFEILHDFTKYLKLFASFYKINTKLFKDETLSRFFLWVLHYLAGFW